MKKFFTLISLFMLSLCGMAADEVTQMTARLKELTLGIGDILAADCQVEFFTTDGRRLEHAQKGIVVMKITHADGTVNIRKMKVE